MSNNTHTISYFKIGKILQMWGRHFYSNACFGKMACFFTYPGIKHIQRCQMKQRHDGFIQSENDADITQREQHNIFSFWVTGLRSALRVEGTCGQPVSTKSSNITDVLENKLLHKTKNFICFHLIRPEGFQKRSINPSKCRNTPMLWTHFILMFGYDEDLTMKPYTRRVFTCVKKPLWYSRNWAVMKWLYLCDENVLHE